MIAPPEKTDHGFFNTYLLKSPDTDLISALQNNLNEILGFAKNLSEQVLDYRYAEGKWSVREILAHLVDAERNFCYRIMRISRGDVAPLPAFDIHWFVVNSSAAERSRDSILKELELLRKATIIMFEDMNPVMLDRTGPARDVTVSVRALGFILVGHGVHHMDILKERYLAAAKN